MSTPQFLWVGIAKERSTVLFQVHPHSFTSGTWLHVQLHRLVQPHHKLTSSPFLPSKQNGIVGSGGTLQVVHQRHWPPPPPVGSPTWDLCLQLIAPIRRGVWLSQTAFLLIRSSSLRNWWATERGCGSSFSSVLLIPSSWHLLLRSFVGP